MAIQTLGLSTPGESKSWDGYTYHPPTDFNPQHEYWQGLQDWFNRGGQRLSKREAMATDLVFRCLQAKALAVQDALPQIQKLGEGNEWQPDLTHPAMYALRRPNRDNTFADILSFIFISEDVYGQVYLELIRSGSGAVVGLRPLEHHTVQEMPKPGAPSFGINYHAAYRIEDIAYYTVSENTLRRVEPENILNIRSHDIRSPLHGLTALDVASEKIGMGKALTKYARAYLEAGGPSGLLTIKNRQLTDQQAQAVQDKWYQRYNLLRGKQTGRVAVLDEDGAYQQLGGHLKELDNENLRMDEQASICTAFGVPGQVVQAYYAIRWGNQRAGQESALRQFWDLTLSPTLARYRQIFDKDFLPEFEGQNAGIKWRVFWDLQNVKALAEDVDKKADRSRKNYAGDVITLNEARAEMGLKPLPDGDKLRSQAAEERAMRAAEMAAQNQPNNKGKLKPDDDQKKSFEMKRAPNAHELRAMEAVRAAQDEAAASIAAVCTRARASLVASGLAQLSFVTNAEAIRLDFPENEALPLNQAITAALNRGRQTAADEARGQKALIELSALVALLFGVASTGLLNQVKARIVAIYVRYLLRGLSEEEATRAAEAEMRDESLAYVDELAQGIGYQAVAEGRAREFDLQAQPGDRWQYSAILDKNTCQPCKDDDLTENSDRAKIPPAPNPKCEGRWRCRCMHVLIRN